MAVDPELQHLIEAVQHNCDMSDAQFAGDYTMCVYLLKMREFFRWERGIALGERLDSRSVGAWVEGREHHWAQLLDREPGYLDLTWKGACFAPFSADPINQVLSSSQLVYGGGYGRFGKPHFFIADLLRSESLQGYQVWIAGREYARELVAPPAMAQGRTIYIRRESLRRMLWELVEEWGWRKRENALARAIGCYGFDQDQDRALEAMTENELENAILHEIGELVAGELIGERWNDMLFSVARTSAEAQVRAVRDHLADCLSSLPAILNEENNASLHFHFANMSPLRKEIFPALNNAYERWLNSGDAQQLKRAVREGKQHWLAVTDQIMETYQEYKEHSAPRIQSLVTQSYF